MIPLMMAFAEMSIAMIFRLNDESFSILKFVVHLLIILFGAGIILNVKRKIIYFLKKTKEIIVTNHQYSVVGIFLPEKRWI